MTSPTFSAGSAGVKIVPDFTNAHKLIKGWFSGLKDVDVDIKPNLDQAAQARVRQQLDTLGRNQKVPVEIDHKLLERSIVRALDSLSGLSDTAAKLGLVLSAKTAAVALFGGALTELAAAASQASGALLLAPALVTGLVAPIGAVVVATRGLSDAFKALASGDIAKINQALDNLSPSAREFVTQMYSLKGAFHDLRLDVQESLFRGLGDSFFTLARNALPILNNNLSAMAEAMGEAAGYAADVLSSNQGMADLQQILGNVATATQNFSAAAAPLTQILLDITSVGSEFLPGMAQSLADGAQSLADWVHNARETGQLRDIIQGAIDVLHKLFDLLVQVGGTVVAIFHAASDAGLSLLDTLTSVFNDFNHIVSMPTGQSSLKAFFDSISDAFVTLRPALSAVFDVLVNSVLPAFGKFFDEFSPVAASLLERFAQVFADISPLLSNMAGPAAALLQGVEPLLDVFDELAQTVLPPLTRLMQDLAPIFSDLTKKVGEGLVQAMHTLEPLLNTVAKAITAIFDAAAPLLPALLDLANQILPPLVDILMQVIPPIVQLVQQLMPVFVQVIQELAPHLAGMTKAIGDLLIALLPLLPPLGDLLSLILPPLAVAIGLVIDVISGWIEAMAILITKVIDFVTAVVNWFHSLYDTVIPIAEAFWKTISGFFQALWDDITRITQAIWDWVTNAWTTLRDAVLDYAQHLWSGLVAIFTGMRDNIVGFTQGIWDGVTFLWNTLRDTVVGVAQNIWDRFVDIFSRMKDGVVGIWDTMWQTIRDVWANVKGAAAAPVNFIIRTVLRDGIIKGWNWLVDAVGLGDANGGGIGIDTRAQWLQGIPENAYGGPIPGTNITDAIDITSGGRVRGRVLGPRSDNVLARVTPDEFVIQQPIAKRHRAFLEALNANQPEAVQAAGGANANPNFLPGYAAGGNVQRAIDIARAMTGTPYIWGGAGPNGADCSGFMSIMTRAIRDEANPYRRIGTTSNFPWPGFSQGYGDPFTIGNTRNAFNSGIGHMAGSLPGHSVESGSGHGPRLDGGALNAGNPLFFMRAFLSDISGSKATAENIAVEDPWFVKLWHTVTGAFDWIKNLLPGMPDWFHGNMFGEDLYKLPEMLPGKLWDLVKNAIGSLFTGYEQAQTVDQANAAGSNASRADLETIVKAAFAPGGWNTGSEWGSVSSIISNESGWNPRAQNPSSSASGLFQMIDGTWVRYRPAGNNAAHMKDAGVPQQAQAGRSYIADKYGDPNAAWRYWQSHHSYDNAGWLPPGLTTVFNGTGRPEAVLTAGEHESLMRWRTMTHQRAESPDALINSVSIHAGSGAQAGEIMDELWHRLKVVRRGGKHALPSIVTVA